MIIDVDDLIVSSRIRLARNFADVQFLNYSKEIAEDNIKDVFFALNEGNLFHLQKMKDLTEEEKQTLVEKHLISRLLVKNKHGAVVISEDEKVAIMINEEDHLRLQCIQEGNNLKRAFDRINEIDEILLNEFEFAYTKDLGFLTTCISNVGTGMRASVMVFLPALTRLNRIKDIIKKSRELGYAVRGEKGEGTSPDGDLYQISNEVTLGLTEREIILRLEDAARQVLNLEVDAQKQLLKNDGITEIYDEICRSCGILQTAYILTPEELVSLMSSVKLGVLLGLVEFEDSYSIKTGNRRESRFSPIKRIDNLIKTLMVGTISLLEQDMVDYDAELKVRAKYVREFMKGVVINI